VLWRLPSGNERPERDAFCRVTLNGFSRMERAHRRDVAVVVDARQERHVWPDPARERRHDAGGLGGSFRAVQPKLLDDQSIYQNVGRHVPMLAVTSLWVMTRPSSGAAADRTAGER